MMRPTYPSQRPVLRMMLAMLGDLDARIVELDPESAGGHARMKPPPA